MISLRNDTLHVNVTDKLYILYKKHINLYLLKLNVQMDIIIGIFTKLESTIIIDTISTLNLTG